MTDTVKKIQTSKRSMRVRKKEGVIDLGCYFLEHLLLTIIDAVLRRDRMARFGMTFSDSGASDGID